MAIFKCKICGGTLEFSEGSSVCECQYCGTRQTLPQISGEHSTTLYERADHFRRNNDFDKAISIYEQILNENNTDAEAYWSLVLCRYGVEYVEDPKSNKRIATVNRMQYTSVLADEDYKSAIKYADPAQKEIYEAEAKEIDSIQKGILAISQKEEPFDVFICYKETDNSGRRTPDSVLANELYHQLDNEGFKVFFSRITLEDKLGTAYEPYIFAALNSAKVMVVIGTKPEYFNAVWVRNEWSRFLALIKNGANKVLIPAYRDMDPYDLPEEFSHLQAQDMSKLGFMQDLIRGIEKLTSASKPKQVKEQPVQSGANTAPLLRRAFLFLEDGDWTSADEYCEKVLDLDPESGEAYLGKMMSELKIRRRELLPEQEERFDNNPQYKKVLRFGSTQLQEELKSATKAINERAERKRLSIAYKKAASLFASAKAKEDYLDAAEAFDAIGDFEDAKERAKACREKYDEVYYGGLYTAAVAAMGYAKSEEDFVKAGKAFDKIKDYKDSAKLSAECVTKAEYARKNAIYTEAVACMTGSKVQNYKKAISKFEKIRDFKDSERKIEWCNQKIEQINEAILAADIAKQNRAQARAEALQAGASAIKEKLPLIKKIALVVVPVLVIAIVASLVLPKIDFSKLQKPDSSISNDLPGDNTTESSSSTETSETETGETESTETGTTENQQSSTQTPSTQTPSTQTPTPQKPSTQPPATQPPTTTEPPSTTDPAQPGTESGYTVEVPNMVGKTVDFDPGQVFELWDAGLTPKVVIQYHDTAAVHTVYEQIPTAGQDVKEGTEVTLYVSCGKDPNKYPEEYYEYTVSNGEVTITGVQKHIYGDVVIPQRIGGYPIVAIGESAFEDCRNLISVAIPSGVTSIGYCAFSGCHNLFSVTMPNSVVRIDHLAFYVCGLVSATIPNSVTSIGNYAFMGCPLTNNLIIPDSVSSIGIQAFGGCDNVTSVTIGKGTTYIDEDAFHFNETLSAFWVDEGNASYSNDSRGVLFNKDKTILKSAPGALSGDYIVPEGVSYVGEGAFDGCDTLTSLTIPDSITGAGRNAFRMSVKTVYFYSEAQKENLKDLFPSGVEFIVLNN